MVSSIVSNENELLAAINRSLDALRYHVDLIGHRNYVDQRLYLGREIDRLATAFDALTAAFSPPPEPVSRRVIAKHHWSEVDGELEHTVTHEPAPSSPVPVEAVRWQPIETAPKDGTHVLVCFGEVSAIRAPTVAHWFEPTPSPGPMAGGWYLSVQQNEGPAVLPTHWQPVQPLPAAPAHREVGE